MTTADPLALLDPLLASLDRLTPAEQDRVARQIEAEEQRDPRYWLELHAMNDLIARAAAIPAARLGGVTG